MHAQSLPVSRRRIAAGGLLVLALLVVGLRHLHPGADGNAAALRVAPVRATDDRRPAHGAVVVDVEGAVRHPGLVRVRSGARVVDAVAHAGGMTRVADRGGINLAAPVSDGQQVVVPAHGTAAAVGRPVGAPTVGPVSLSSASAEQLDTLPGVGPVTAQKIVEYRAQHGSFHSVEELDAIPGIGPSRLADLQGLVVP